MAHSSENFEAVKAVPDASFRGWHLEQASNWLVRIANSGKVTQHWPNLGGVSRMEPDFERLLHFSPVLCTPHVWQIHFGPNNCQTTCQLIQPVVGLSNWGPAYCQETCLMSEKSWMPRLCILTQDWHSLTICFEFVFSNIWIDFVWLDSTRR